MKKVISFFAIVVGIFSFWFYTRHPLVATVTIRNEIFTVDVAVTPKEKELGLGNRDGLAPNHGMLFVYDHKERYSYWMKNMRFPIDIIWIDDRTIVDITKNVQPSTILIDQLPIYHPIVPIDKVLELPAGISDRVGIIIGDKITIKS